MYLQLAIINYNKLCKYIKMFLKKVDYFIMNNKLFIVKYLFFIFFKINRFLNVQ